MEKNIFNKAYICGSPGGSVVKNPPASAGHTGDKGLISELGRSSREGNGHHCSITAWKFPWTEELGGLQSVRLKRVRHN